MLLKYQHLYANHPALKNKSNITTKWDHCFRCGRVTHMDPHHVIFGKLRKVAEFFGLTIPLCRKCHDLVQTHEELWKPYQALGQRKWMEVFGEHIEGLTPYEAYMKVFKWNYL